MCVCASVYTLVSMSESAAPPAVAEGVPVAVEGLVLSPADLRRQRRELRTEFFVSLCMKMADASVETLPAVALPMCMLNLYAVVLNIVALLVQQLHVPPNGPKVLTCVPNHTLAIIANVFCSAMAVLSGKSELCGACWGYDASRVQRRRLFVLVALALVESLVLLPLVWPDSLSEGRNLGGNCTLDSAAFAFADRPTPVTLFTALSAFLWFSQRAMTLGTIAFALSVLLLGAVLDHPRMLLPYVFFVGCITLASAHYAFYVRTLHNAVLFVVSVVDNFLMQVLSYALLDYGDAHTAGSSFGPTVAFLHAPPVLQKLVPSVLGCFLGIVGATLVNIALVMMGAA